MIILAIFLLMNVKNDTNHRLLDVEHKLSSSLSDMENENKLSSDIENKLSEMENRLSNSEQKVMEKLIVIDQR